VSGAAQIIKKLQPFRAWLSQNGAEVLEVTSEWEIVRFVADGVTSVIYRNLAGKASFTGESQKAWDSFKNAQPWRASAAAKSFSRAAPKIRTIRKRDGDLCFFCQERVNDEDASVEHLVAQTHGGTKHISNLFLAHKKCNSKAGNLSAPEKIKIHVSAVIKRMKP